MQEAERQAAQHAKGEQGNHVPASSGGPHQLIEMHCDRLKNDVLLTKSCNSHATSVPVHRQRDTLALCPLIDLALGISVHSPALPGHTSCAASNSVRVRMQQSLRSHSGLHCLASFGGHNKHLRRSVRQQHGGVSTKHSRRLQPSKRHQLLKHRAVQRGGASSSNNGSTKRLQQGSSGSSSMQQADASSYNWWLQRLPG